MKLTGSAPLNDGVVCYLRKPVDEQHLNRCLARFSRPVTDPEEVS
jgi:response regulator of citrate/malate metabolism